MQRTRVAALLGAQASTDKVLLKGWIRTRRDARDFSFLEINDGSCLANIQVLVGAESPACQSLKQLSTGASVAVTGALVESPGKEQRWEVRADQLELIGASGEDYPLQKKRHSDEYLRTIAHLRPRTNKYGAMFRIRSRLSLAVHQFFQQRGFHHVHTPIITSSDCEGAGELFNVTTLNLATVPLSGGKVDYDSDFFAQEAHLTVSGQLSAETLCMGLGDVYTFGPTFRSENSNTSRHIAEFWMIEPEMAFADLQENMDLGEACIKHLVEEALHQCEEDLTLFTRFVDKDLLGRLENIQRQEFARISYTEAIGLLQKAPAKFAFPPQWGHDLQAEHERYLTEQLFGKPVIVSDYPKELKAFYMRLNDDQKTVAAMDILVPGIGELIGGSQREERLDRLRHRLGEQGFHEEDYWWYLDTRRFGSVPHAGFGLGFERLLMLVTGVPNIRDVIPFPRTPRHLEF